MWLSHRYDCVDKKAKITKKLVIKQKIRFEGYEKCLQNNKVILKLQQRFRRKFNKISSKSNNDERLQTLDQVISYPCSISKLSEYAKWN